MFGSEDEQYHKKSMKYIDDVCNKDKKRVVEKQHYDTLNLSHILAIASL
jgi:hypothetical protein